MMVVVAVAFEFSGAEAGGAVRDHQPRGQDVSFLSYAERHCWLMGGPAYLWGLLLPAYVLLLLGLWLTFQAREALRLSAILQVDTRTRNKDLRRRGLQVGLFLRLLVLLGFVLVLGATASLWQLPEIWVAYSLTQGIQVSPISRSVPPTTNSPSAPLHRGFWPHSCSPVTAESSGRTRHHTTRSQSRGTC